MGVLNLEDQLSFYMAYHNDSVNVFIHTICVPIILVTSFTLASPVALLDLPYCNLGVLVSVGYAVFYILLDPYVGTAVAPFVVGSAVNGTDLIKQHGTPGIYVALGLFAISWILQFVGHGVFEKRAPALFDNLVQALVLAPFFVTYEFVFKLGFHKDLQARLEKRVQAELKRIRGEAK